MEDARFYVYGWFNLDWGSYFYIGKGTGDRYRNKNHRSKAFNAITNNWNCEPVLLIDGLTEDEAFENEIILKEKFMFDHGHPIIDGEVASIRKMAQREGIAIAKAQGKYKGRKEVDVPDIEKHYQRYMNREISKPKLAEELGITRPTLDKLFRELSAN